MHPITPAAVCDRLEHSVGLIAGRVAEPQGVPVGDGGGLRRRVHRIEAGSVADVGEVDEHSGVVEGGHHSVPGASEPPVVGLPATRSEMVGDVVGELHHPHADVGEDLGHLGVVAEHRAVLEAEDRTEHVVGRRDPHLLDARDHADGIGIVAAQMAEGADPRHGAGKVLPHPHSGVDDVHAARSDLVDDVAGPVVDLETVDDHARFPGRAGRTQSSLVPASRSLMRGAPWNSVTLSQSVDLGLKLSMPYIASWNLCSSSGR